MPLALSQTGDTVVIREIKAHDDVRQHLIELGFITGDKVTVDSPGQG